MYSGVGAPNGSGTKSFDRWFRYPAGFSVQTLEACYSALNTHPDAFVVDPFAGVGTIGVKSDQLGIISVGIEAHPQIAELASLKFRRPDSPEHLLQQAESLVADEKRGDPRSENSLVIKSFEHETLTRLLGLRDSIKQLDEGIWQLYLKWSLLGALRDCASASVGWPYQRPGTPRKPRMADPYRAFIRRARWMVEDLDKANPSVARVQTGDSRSEESWVAALDNCKANAVVTSPPYLNNFDYADATRLELYFWGVAQSWKQMTDTVRSGMIVATTQQTKKTLALEALEKLEKLCPKTHGTVAELTSLLRQERERRPRGKEYDRLVPSYFADLTQVLVRIRSHTTPQAPVVLVLGDSAPYGVYIDTPRILASAANELGFRTEFIRPLRQRGLRWHTNGKRHSVELSEQLVLLRSPD